MAGVGVARWTRGFFLAGATALSVVAMHSAVSGADDDGDFPLTAALRPATLDEPPLRSYPLRGSRRPAEMPPAATAELGGETVLFLDVDGNGSFGDRGVDAWMLPGKDRRHAVPVEKWLVLGTRQIWLRFAADGESVAYRSEEFVPVERPGERLQKKRNLSRRRPSQILAALLVWNDLRLRNGLAPGRLDATLSDGCHKHANYCSRHGITHREYPEKDAYTEAGDEAGRWSGIGSAEPSVEVDFAYRSLFHRMQLIHATTEEIGIGYAKGVTVLDGSRGRGRRKWTYPVCIPAAETSGHPRQCAPERPLPHPDVFGSGRALAGAGCPITLTFYRDDVREVRAELREKGPEGRPVPFLLSSPEDPANASIPDNYKTIGLLPRIALKARKRYWVRVAYTYLGEPGTRTWTFTTGTK